MNQRPRHSALSHPMKIRTFTVIIHKEDETYIAECPEVGTIDQGDTIEQAIAGLQEATRLYLATFSIH
jgi:predicted RNase H-like HicB family nuclease